MLANFVIKFTSFSNEVLKFLNEGEVLNDLEEAQKVRNRVTWSMLLGGVLYKRGFSKPLLR